MAKRGSKPPVVVDKRKFLLPKMEWFEIDPTTGEGLYFTELGGAALLEFKEAVEAIKKDAADDAELKPRQAIELMAKFVVLSACDANGHPLFEEGDIPLLIRKNPNLLLDMANKAMPLSGINPNSISEVAVNLPKDQPSSSSTD